MLSAPTRAVTEAVIYVAASLLVIGGFTYAEWKWWTTNRSMPLKPWRRVLAQVGFFAVGAQAILFCAYWGSHSIDREPRYLGLWARLVVFSFAIGFPLAFFGKGTSRWLLVASSIFFFAACSLIVLSV
jgi:hypothetical protein